VQPMMARIATLARIATHPHSSLLLRLLQLLLLPDGCLLPPPQHHL
jgi:hypothetical protein